ncbi:asparagine synthase (glutamine-hydrolyzing) [Nocardia sp. 004]|uniref:asparagine synthase (glutamine-hydrolyzing) n=1 Tax=Nocardia sp. 004 TaxID=3385978 RepID=UPI00399EF41C
MCGINVVVSWCADIGSAEISDLLGDMNSCLAHRGPDDAAVWVEGNVGVGHTRLKVIDLEGGQQPVVGERYVLVFNGEIYNYLELREELRELGYEFREHGDTEVLSIALECWGEGAVDRLNGDFAFVLLDRVDNTILMCRDRLGVKPLYFKDGPRCTIISSEPKGILAAEKRLDPASVPVLNRMALMQSMLYGTPVPPTTFFEGIEALRGGEFVSLCLRTRRVRRTRYWDFADGDNADSRPAALGRISGLLEDSVALRMRSDVDYSLMLSGGLDSSLVAYLAGAREGGTRAYTIGDHKEREHSEKSLMTGSDLVYARTVAAEAGHALKEFDLDGGAVSYVRRCALARDSVVTIASEVSMMKLFEKVTESDTVVLSGEGADEVFLGYYWQTDRGKISPYFASQRALLGFILLNPGFMNLRRASAEARRHFDEEISRLPRGIREDNSRMMHYLQLRLILPYLLDRADRLSAAHSLELRVPFCDHRLAEYVFGLPAEHKYTEEEKKILRDSFAGRFNDDVIYRKKSMFPYSEDAAYLEEMRSEVARILADNRKRGGIVSQVYRTSFIQLLGTRFLGTPVLFRLLIRVVGTYYTQAFMCQIISIDTLEQRYGLTVQGGSKKKSGSFLRRLIGRIR